MQAQKSKSRQNLETAVNISLIVVCLALAGLVVKKYIFTSQIKSLAVGDTISLHDTSQRNNQKSFLLFLQSGCQYCTKSKYFYNEVINDLPNESNIKILALFSDEDNHFEDYLKELGLQNIEARKTDFAKVGVEGTPTLAIIDENGKVQNVWKGILSPKKEIEVKQKLGFQVNYDDLFIEESNIDDLRKKDEEITVIDLRERDVYAKKHFTNAVNIPLDELSVRAINEFSLSDKLAVYGTFDNEGENALEILAKEGFRKVYILRYKFQ